MMQKVRDEDRVSLTAILQHLQQYPAKYFTAHELSRATKFSLGGILRLLKCYQDIFTKLPGRNDRFMLNTLREHRGEPAAILQLLEAQTHEQAKLERLLQKAYTPYLLE